MSDTSTPCSGTGSRAEVVRKIRESEENVTYWKARRIMAVKPTDKADAGARVLAWEMNLRHQKSKLEAFNALCG